MFPVIVLCRVLNIHRSSYYDWKHKGATIIPPEELALRRRMKALFESSRQSLGSRRLVQKLREEGFDIGCYRVRTLMKHLGLKVKYKRRFKVTTNSKHQFPFAENILNRQFNPVAANRA
ncbi:MAG: IS3 family transposase [Gammaproteobacteria bacterium]|nr:IS3 family transposase [Gammaproteobacteria bacterium]